MEVFWKCFRNFWYSVNEKSVEKNCFVLFNWKNVFFVEYENWNSWYSVIFLGEVNADNQVNRGVLKRNVIVFDLSDFLGCERSEEKESSDGENSKYFEIVSTASGFHGTWRFRNLRYVYFWCIFLESYFWWKKVLWILVSVRDY